MTRHTLGNLVMIFFRSYLGAQKGCSPNTIASYSDCIRLLLNFCSQRLQKSIEKLSIEEISDDLVLSFLDYLETDRHNSPQTRNTRLAAIKTYFRFLASQDPELISVCERVCQIHAKKTTAHLVEGLERNELDAILNACDTNTIGGLRTYALLRLMYITGARVQEALDIKLSDLRLEKPYTVILMGKGRKERVIPLDDDTVTALKAYLKHREMMQLETVNLFVNLRGMPLTRFGVLYLIQKLKKKAQKICPSLVSKKVSSHTFRHTTALHMLQSSIDITVISKYLGHANLSATNHYTHINMEMKRKALKTVKPQNGKVKSEQPQWRDNKLLTFLEDLSRKVQLCEA